MPPISTIETQSFVPQRSLPAIASGAKRLRVAIVSDAIRGRNGVGTYYDDLVHYLTPELDAVHLVSPYPKADHLEKFAIPLPGDATQRLAIPKKRELYQCLDRLQPHVIVLPSLGGYSYRGLRFAQSRKLPVVVVNHTNFEHLLSLYWPDLISRPLRTMLRRLNRWLCRQARSVAAMNSSALQDASQAGAELVRVMGTPIAPLFLDSPTTPCQESLGRVLFVGRLAEEKGLEQLLQAALALPQTQFTIAGDGPLQAMIKNFAQRSPNVKYVGWLTRPEVLEHIDASQLLVLPSRFETFGTVALEALARRRFVLTSQQCGISKWPSLAEGIFQFEPDELTSTLRHIAALPHAARNAFAEPSWQAVRRFNANTIRNWIRFLVDSAQPLDRSPTHTESP